MIKGIIHCIAHCADCEWQDEDYNNARMEGFKHNKETGHEVNIEVGRWIQYARRQKNEKKV